MVFLCLRFASLSSRNILRKEKGALRPLLLVRVLTREGEVGRGGACAWLMACISVLLLSFVCLFLSMKE